jgi:hypothetical protein
MKGDFEKVVLEETLTSELADCLVHEAFKKIENAAKENGHTSVFDAFLNLGRVKAILGNRFEKVRQELYEKAKEKFLSPDTSEHELRNMAANGLACGELRAFPIKINKHFIHYGFVADIAGMEIKGIVRYVEGMGWEEWKGRAWQRRPKERGIVGLIYEVMKDKINIWREALADVNGAGGWLGELERNISDPDWLSKVEELLLRVDYFRIVIVSDDD